MDSNDDSTTMKAAATPSGKSPLNSRPYHHRKRSLKLMTGIKKWTFVIFSGLQSRDRAEVHFVVSASIFIETFSTDFQLAKLPVSDPLHEVLAFFHSSTLGGCCLDW